MLATGIDHNQLVIAFTGMQQGTQPYEKPGSQGRYDRVPSADEPLLAAADEVIIRGIANCDCRHLVKWTVGGAFLRCDDLSPKGKPRLNAGAFLAEVRLVRAAQ